ncbi:MAG: Transposase, IS4 family [Bacteroidetes bacterium 38_7]|nr:MAG: Transposase, IS4 family [Bacteroidetes bacterium 38_7]
MVIDAGITTDDNLKLLKSEGYKYVCVSRSRLKDYQFCEMEPVRMEDN